MIFLFALTDKSLYAFYMALKSDPIPTRFDVEDIEKIERLHIKTGMPKSEIVRRCVRFALPLFESGSATMNLYGPPKKVS